MSKFPEFSIDNQWITSRRGPKNNVDPYRPYHFFTEKECITPGSIEDVNTLLLTNKECPYRCLMCDLWQNTTDETVETGAIPAQIEYALSRLPSAKHVKLYNSGSFFDHNAIPPDDYVEIAHLVYDYKSVIVESHPMFIGDSTLRLRELLKTQLQVAVGLETVHPEILPRLNKKMKLPDFEKAIRFLNDHGIASRAYILHRTPFLSEEEGIQWTKKSIDFAFTSGVEACSLIPVRAGNGAMDELAGLGYFSPPSILSLEEVLEYGIRHGSGPVYADLWDIERFSSCELCMEERIERLKNMNLEQQIYPQIKCSCRGKLT